jgi:hypothetical protein
VERIVYAEIIDLDKLSVQIFRNGNCEYAHLLVSILIKTLHKVLKVTIRLAGT